MISNVASFILIFAASIPTVRWIPRMIRLTRLPAGRQVSRPGGKDQLGGSSELCALGREVGFGRGRREPIKKVLAYPLQISCMDP